MTGILGALLSSGGAAAPGGSLLLDSIATSASAAYSTRKLRSAYAGSALRVRQSNTPNDELDIGFVADELDTATISSFVTTGNAQVSKWYDQSGNGHDVTASGYSNIAIASVIQTVNSKPAISYLDSSFSAVDPISSIITATAWTTMTGMSISVATATNMFLGVASTYWRPFLIGPGTGSGAKLYAEIYDGGFKAAVVDNFAFDTPVIITARQGGGTMGTYANGGTPGTVSVGTIGQLTDAYGSFAADIELKTTEILCFASALSSADVNVLGADMAARVGSTWTDIA